MVGWLSSTDLEMSGNFGITRPRPLVAVRIGANVKSTVDGLCRILLYRVVLLVLDCGPMALQQKAVVIRCFHCTYILRRK